MFLLCKRHCVERNLSVVIEPNGSVTGPDFKVPAFSAHGQPERLSGMPSFSSFGILALLCWFALCNVQDF